MPHLRPAVVALLLLTPALTFSGGAVELPIPETGPYLPIEAGSLAAAAPAATYTLPDGRSHEVRSWGPAYFNAPEAWARGITGAGVRVGIVDTGIDLTHPYLQDSIAWSRSLCGGTAQDGNGHGTHVAGIVKQTAPDVSLYVVRLAGADGTFCTDAVTGMLAAAKGPDGVLKTADDPHILSVSLGQKVPVGEALSLLWNDAPTLRLIRDAGIVMVVAAGNSFVTPSPDYPGGYPETIAVAALESSGAVALYSSNGRTDGDDTRITKNEIEVAAPGSSISSTVPRGVCESCHSSGWASLSGTSMATPHVAGILALLHQAAPWSKDGDSVENVRARLRCGSQDLVLSGKLSGPGYDMSTGYGLPKMDALLDGRCIFTHRSESLAILQRDVQRTVENNAETYTRIVNNALGRFGADAEDYDGDGVSDANDPVNSPSDGLVLTTGADRLTVTLRAGGVALAQAPDGSVFGVASRTFAGTVTLRFDGAVTPTGADVTAILPASPALVDGTWVLQTDARVGGSLASELTLSVGGKTVSTPGAFLSGAASGYGHFWNWHRQDTPEYRINGGVNTYPPPEQTPRYLRLYLGTAGLLP
ncbi:MAG TPA: S8 family serine peptidase [Candidatus Thermoplasmatota archaeon]|nr:S8 family serine peptidase [Candidatus Thermoplasmatota archaeon]